MLVHAGCLFIYLGVLKQSLVVKADLTVILLPQPPQSWACATLPSSPFDLVTLPPLVFNY